MKKHETYISFVIQTGLTQKFEKEIVSFPPPPLTYLVDNTAKEVMKWAEAKEKELPDGSKIIVTDFFNLN